MKNKTIYIRLMKSLLLIFILFLPLLSCWDVPVSMASGDNITVIFNSLGGSIVPARTAASGSLLSNPQTPSRINYDFSGWYKDTSLTSPWDFSTDRVYDDIILYAKWTYNGIPETFDVADRPSFIQNVAGDYYLCEPWNYNKAINSGREYPLFVYLHGAGSSGVPGVLPCFYNNDTQMKSYPCFIYLPHTAGSWNNATLITQIENIKASYRIDTNRIYLMGYSMGGSGSYSLANAYYDHNQHLFAGIVRMAGQSQTTVRNAIADKTSIWYHVGADDTEVRVQVAADSYDFLKNYPGNSSAIETSSAVPLSSYPGTTLTLTKNGIEIIKYTVYDSPVAHGVSHFPLTDPYLLQWLFMQSLDKR